MLGKIQTNVSLKPYNTFGIECRSKYFVAIERERDVEAIFRFISREKPRHLVIGGGSNLLFKNDFFDGLTIHNRLKGIRLISENEHSVIIETKGGEIWDDFVQFCVSRNYYGVENLSLIPGTTGAAPVQNIGAYGVELQDIFHSLTALHLETGERKIFSKEDCLFGYRDSYFKSREPDTYLIESVRFRITKTKKLSLDYAHLKEQLPENPELQEVRALIINIRRNKLPDTEVTGNAGSFFKNPFVSREKLDELRNLYPRIPFYVQGDKLKIAAGWLIEQAGWKGKRIGDAGVHGKQALVLVNYGNSSGQDILSLASLIENSVFQKFGLRLEREVRVY